MDTTTSPSTRPSASESTVTDGADGCAAIAAAASAARSGVRASTRTERAPRSHSASPVEAAVAPPPSTVAAVTGPSYRSRIAATAPGQVGVVGEHDLAVLEQQRVRGTGERRPGRDGARQSERPALERHRQRQPAPARVEPDQEAGELVLGDPDRVVLPVQPGGDVPGPVQRRRERVGDRVAQDRAPLHVSAVGLVAQYSSRYSALYCEELVVGSSANFVSPVFRLTVT